MRVWWRHRPLCVNSCGQEIRRVVCTSIMALASRPVRRDDHSGPQCFFCTLFGPDRCQMTMDTKTLHILASHWQADVHVSLTRDTPLVVEASLNGIVGSQLSLTP